MEKIIGTMNQSHNHRATICHHLYNINSRGVFAGDDPLSYSVPSLLLQLSLISVITRLVQFFLKPFGQPLIVAQILGGVVLGPSLLGQDAKFLARVFPRKSILVIDTMSLFGFMLFIFMIGVKVDLSMALRSGKKAMAVGILGFFLPFGLSGLVAFLLHRFLYLDADIATALPYVVETVSMTAFPVITFFLDDLKILNSEIGRLASSSSIICDICLWSLIFIKYVTHFIKEYSIICIMASFISVFLFFMIIVFIIRPAALWVISHTPEPRPVKELYIFLALVVLMICGFLGEAIGLHATAACLVLGLVIPDGPPFGSTLVDTLDCFVSVILMPLFFMSCGLRMDVFSIRSFTNVGVLQMVVFVAFIGKILGSMLPLIYFRMPLRDAFSLGLIMNTKGIIELAFLTYIRSREIVTEEVYAIMVISVVSITGVIAPVVKLLYDPSKRFVAYKRRTILHSKGNDELRILACIHRSENVYSIISLLRVSSPTEDSPIHFVVLHLVKLMGRASALLVPHRQREKPSKNFTESERIFNAFIKFEQKTPENLHVDCYKGISPYMTMHNDVCSLALEKRTILIVLPFHKQWVSQETVESSNAYRHLNKCVLEKAPCSVAILIDHRSLKSRYVLSEKSAFKVVVLFFGGADDREALAYAQRMSNHSRVSVTVMRFIASGPSIIVAGTERSKMLDSDSLSNFKLKMQRTDYEHYKEKVVSNGTDVILATRSAVKAYNLVLVGRRHGESPIMIQLTKWKERGDLGVIGEILAASEFKGESSVLVVQQQTKLWGLKDPEESTHLRRVKL